MTSQFRRFALGRGSSNASAYRRRTITRTFISTWANGRRSAAPTARPGSASIHDWGHLKPIRPIAYTSDAPAASNGRSPVQGLASSRRLEREAGRNVEVMWLLRRLVPDDKVIADFRKDNSKAIRKVCARFVDLCREMGLLTRASVAIDGSKFKAVNNRDQNFTRGKVERRRAQLEERVARYLSQLDTADRHEPTEALATKTERLKEKLAKLTQEMAKLAAIEAQMLAAPDQQVSLTDPDSRSMATSGRGSGVVGYNVQVAVDTEHHLIVAHEVTNSGSDCSQLANMAKQAK